MSAGNYIVPNVKKHDEIEFFKKFKSVSTYNTLKKTQTYINHFPKKHSWRSDYAEARGEAKEYTHFNLQAHK